MTGPWSWVERLVAGPEQFDSVKTDPEFRQRAHRLAEVLTRISRPHKVGSVWSWTVAIMDMPFDDDGRRKPLAGVTTSVTAAAYEALTGLEWTRVSKKVKGQRGLKETGQFAKVLGEVFAILDIKASAAGQVALLQKAKRTLWKLHRGT